MDGARLGSRIAAVGLGAAVVAGAARRLGDFDLPWHLALGRQVVATHAAVRVDDLSYTFAGSPMRHEALGDTLLYLATRAGGAVGLQVLAALVLALIAVLGVVRAGREARLFGLALVSLALVASGSWLVVRPALLSFGFLAASLALLDGQRAGGATARLAWLVPLQWAWAATHGFAPLGAALALGLGVHALACRAARGRLGGLFPVEEGRDAPRVLAIAVVAAVVTCLGPLGPDIYLLPARMRGYDAYITEWAPTTLDFLVRFDPVALVLFAAAPMALSWGRGRRAPSAFDVAVVVVTAALALKHVRLIPLFALASAPILARRLALALAGARLAPVLAPALAIVCGLVAAPSLWASPGTRPGLGFDEKNQPEGAVQFVRGHQPAGALWNFSPFGGWLSWRLYPDVRVFIDGRTGWLYPRAFVEEYFRAQHDPAAFAALAAKWRFEWAVVRGAPGERFDEPLASDPAWTMVYLDDAAAVYVRRAGPNAALATEGYRALRHLTPPGALLVAPPAAADLEHDARLALAQAPDSPRARFFVAAAAIASGDLPRARAARDALAAIAPDYPGLVPLASLLDGPPPSTP